ncbi:unnamed protein product [Peronospora belbahrii]|uniref:Centromere/kinetochore protein zw10 n=1 Tax=Peronospora belbahrii TaxID=622444 RepID=A0AAU9KZK6_9STRA|nr:unnamed protein product [Peronospora belbahrii]
MATLETLTRKLEDTYKEISQVRREVIETLRFFYSSSAAISADEAINIAVEWGAPHSMYMERDELDASDLQQRMRRLNVMLLNAVDRLQLNENSEMAPEAQLLLSFTHREQLKLKMQQSKSMLTLIEQLAKIDRLLRDVDEAIERHSFVAAAEGVVKMDRLVKELEMAEKVDEGNADDTKIIRVVKLQVLSKKNWLLNQLTRYISCTAIWKDNALKMATDLSSDVYGATMLTVDERRREFWKACEVLGILTPKLQDIAKAVSEHLITPILQIQSETLKYIEDDGVVILKVMSQLMDGDNGSVKSGVDELQEKCTNVVKVLQFVHAELFTGSAELMGQLGDFMWKIPGNLEAKLLNLLEEKIPQDASALEAYREAAMTSVESLENALVVIGFSACRHTQLRGFVDQLSELHAKKRRQAILSSGRDLMRQGYHNSVKVTGGSATCSLYASSESDMQARSDEKTGWNAMPDKSGSKGVESSCFEIPNFRVTVCAYEVVELVHETLVEACNSGETSANLLFQTARDLFFLYRIVVSTLYDDDIANDPRICMLYHNDCLYITYHMVVIGHIYKHRLPAPLNRTATMMDMVPSFQELGERALTSFVSRKMEEFVSGMNSLPSLGALDSEHNLECVERFLKSALYRLQGMSSSWRDGLPLAVYNKVMSRMLEPIVKIFVDGILTEANISEITRAYLHHLLSLLLESEALFASPSQAAKFVPTFEKLLKLRAILVDPLATVRDKFNSGSLDVFSSKELAGVARSLFRESSEQQDFVQELLTN